MCADVDVTEKYSTGSMDISVLYASADSGARIRDAAEGETFSSRSLSATVVRSW
jgi:hypothetical protein